MKTTYMSSGESSDHVNGTFNREPISMEKKVTLKDVHRMLGTKEKILPENLIEEEVMSGFSPDFSRKDLTKVFSYPLSGQKSSFEIIGYAPTLEVLSKFGDVSPSDEERITEMDMSQGINYLFHKVLPAMKKYVNS
ncbi:hypothetical protein GOV13_01015 [Candidatus Pacearchaeota archaeon]|nr:hypothetical protein [Candidatus Pacearchaeota archaeon]